LERERELDVPVIETVVTTLNPDGSVNCGAMGVEWGAERIVIERKTGKAYYTRDHYETFVPMN